MIRLAFLTFLSLLATASQAQNPCVLSRAEDGIGGTGLLPVEDGIGGTGAIIPSDGIGGTGKQASNAPPANVAVIGIVTGFASVCVNGIEIHYTNATPADSNGVQINSADLAIGQLVSINAEPTPQGLTASHIHVQHAVSGSIEHIDAGNGTLSVVGQKVRVTPGSVRDAQGRATTIDQLGIGRKVVVSGIRTADNQIIATRVETPTKPVATTVSGTLKPVDPGIYRIGQLRVRVAPGTAIPDGPAVYRLGPDNATVREVVSLPGQGAAKRLVVQSAVRASEANGVELDQGIHVKINSTTVIRGGTTGDIRPGRLVRIVAERASDNQWQAEILEMQSIKDLSRRAGSELPQSAGKHDKSTSGSDDDDDRDDDDDYKDSSGKGSGKSDRLDKDEDDDDKLDDSVSLNKGSSKSDDMPDHSGKSDDIEKLDKSGKGDKSDKTEKIEKSNKIEKSGKSDKPEKIDKPDKPKKPDKPEKPEKIKK